MCVHVCASVCVCMCVCVCVCVRVCVWYLQSQEACQLEAAIVTGAMDKDIAIRLFSLKAQASRPQQPHDGIRLAGEGGGGGK